MEIDFEHSRLKIGIRDFVSFAQSSYPSTPVHNLGNWRTTLGQQWHQQLWKEAQDQFGENAKAEVCIEGSLHYEGWTFALSGRIDQILYDEDQTVLREVKTTQQLLPQPLAELRAKYPDYFEQLACYQLLLPESFHPEGIPLVPELLMLHIDTGIRQILHLDRPPMEILQPRLASWLDFLEGQRSADRRVKHLVVPTAFETFREDQIPVRELLFRQLEEPGKANASGNKPFIALQAATGFGKTSIAIEWALQGIRQGQFDRVLYLTGKNTGQKQVVDELQRFRQDSEGIRYFQVRNMEQHLRFCPHLHCPCQHRDSGQAATPQLESYLPYVKVDTLIKQGSPDMETIGMTASTYQVCPRLISQSALAISEFWVADYNYVFTPGARALLDSIPAFNPGRCLLILDEVHNLHERVCSNFSATFNSYRGEQVIAALRDTRAPRPFMSAVDALVRFVRSLSEKQVLDTTQTYQLKDLLESIHRQMADNGRTLVNLPESIMEILWDLEVAWQSVQNPRLEMVHWCPRDGSIDITCIHASSIIRETVDSFRKTLFMSATFPAPEVFHEQTRIPSTECLRIDAGSEWRAACYEVGIDARISTTYKNREKNYRKTAQTLLQLRESDPGAVIAFFPILSICRNHRGLSESDGSAS